MQRFTKPVPEFEAECGETCLDVEGMVPKLKAMMSLASRSILIQREHLNRDPWGSYNRLAKLLGAKTEFPKNHEFKIHHANTSSHTKRRHLRDKLPAGMWESLKAALQDDYHYLNQFAAEWVGGKQ